MTIDEKIEQLDLSLFRHIGSQTTQEDQRSLLAVQTAIRKRFPGYTYLEIGSHRGGSLQPYVVDPICASIISIDPRHGATKDCRGVINYKPGGVENMLESLAKIPGADISKISTFETTVTNLTETMIGVRPQLCFVDGEHTDEAVCADARFCISVLAGNGLIIFHDANVIYGGLQNLLKELTASGRVFNAAVIPGSIFLLEFGSVDLCATAPLVGRVRENYKAYLFGMQENDLYRQAYPFSIDRVAKAIRVFYYESAVCQYLRKLKRIFFKTKASKP